MKRTTYGPSLTSLMFALLITFASEASALGSPDTQPEATINTRALGLSVSTSHTADLRDMGAVETSASTSENIGITSLSMSGGDMIMSPSQIGSNTDLEMYKQSILQAKKDIEKIDIHTNKLIISWKHEGELFAFIPISITSRTEVIADNGVATVTTRMPWWSMLVADVTQADKEVDDRLLSSSQIEAYALSPNDLTLQAKAVFAVVAELDVDTQSNTDAILYMGR